MIFGPNLHDYLYYGYLLILQALSKAGRSKEHYDDYVLVEDVQKQHDRGSCQRILDMEESVLQAQSNWQGSGRFILRKKTNVSTTKLI